MSKSQPTLRKLSDAVFVVLREERAKTQMTLGQLILRLEKLLAKNPNLKIRLHDPHSYRGYYSDLAFEVEVERNIREVLSDAKYALDSEFTGYKGGEFIMDKDTPIWLSNYGYNSQLRLIAIGDDGKLVSSIEPESTQEDFDAALEKAKEKFGPNLGGLLNG